MSVLVLLVVVMMMMKAASAGVITVTAHSGSSVLLTSDQLRGVVESGWDVRWMHLPRLMLRKNMTKCHHGRCELLNNGSLKFSNVRANDSGTYSLQVFDRNGKVQVKTDFLLRVEADTSSPQWPLIPLLILLLLPLLVIILFILRRRRNQRTMTAGPMERNVYVSMHRRHSNRRKGEEEKQEKEEESAYVPCQMTVSMETPIKQQMTEEAEDIYV